MTLVDYQERLRQVAYANDATYEDDVVPYDGKHRMLRAGITIAKGFAVMVTDTSRRSSVVVTPRLGALDGATVEDVETYIARCKVVLAVLEAVLALPRALDWKAA